jgi:hypothetical protein
MDKIGGILHKLRDKKPVGPSEEKENKKNEKTIKKESTGTFIEKLNAEWLRKELPEMDIDIFVWRTVNVRFLRAVFHRALGGKFWLKMLYILEEKYPEYFGNNGQYPLIVVHK